MESRRQVYLPSQFAISGSLLRNPIQQLQQPEFFGEVEVLPYPTVGGLAQLIKKPDGTETLVLAKNVAWPTGLSEVLIALNGIPGDASEFSAKRTGTHWLRPRAITVGSKILDEGSNCCVCARASWYEQFFFREERWADGQLVEHGLRPPQIGAIHAALSHWTITADPATIVMPTGTGKTETMLALFIRQRPERLLVVVPNSALREQTVTKFLTLGVLKKCGAVGPAALYPVVGTLKHHLNTPEEVDLYFQRCNVVIATMSAISGCSEDVQRRMAETCSYLFIDEAHHITAPTWEKFRRFFAGKTILQFTATPFRSDGRHVDGKVIFNYPLRKAQQEEYFRTIDFAPVREYNPRQADESIARVAVQTLKRDLSNGQNHIVMARTASIDRAQEIHAIYEGSAGEFHPLLIHSEQSVAKKAESIRLLREAQSRIVVCVNMLGEGFDLPELKIAALHDMHKGLAITLQFTGRFTRTRDDIGNATVIANIADAEVEDALRDLYAEDADWNYLLRRLSKEATDRQVQQSEFLGGFVDLPSEISLQNVFPKMSTVVFRTHCANWRPENVGDVVKEARLYVRPTVNQEHRVALFVTREYEPVPWGEIKDIYNTIWNLYLLHWDEEQKLLFINSSDNESQHEDLARAVAGEDVELIRGEQVFRSLSGINRLILMNLGLNHTLSRAVRFTMYVGSDIREGLSEAHLQNKAKSNLFGRGYENGDKASVGCSYKGRIWSYKIASDILEWVEWCHMVGTKLLNESVSLKEIFDHVIIPKQIHDRPSLVPLVIEWPESLLQRSEEAILLDIGGQTVPFYEVGLELTENSARGPLRFRVFTDNGSAEYEVKFLKNRVEYVPTGEIAVDVVLLRRRISLSMWFQHEPPIIRFENGAYLNYNALFEIKTDQAPFDKERIDVWNWTGIDLRKESQTTARYPDSIQYRVIKELLRPDHDPQYDIVFDDDDAHEAADIIAVKATEERLVVHLFHCKYSKEAKPGARVDDLYAVCGQAQRCVHWKGDIGGLMKHLSLRARSRQERLGVSRFERGDFSKLDEIARRSPFLIPEFKVFIVQPGLLKSKLEADQLGLLAVTELYLQETYAIEFGVIASCELP